MWSRSWRCGGPFAPGGSRSSQIRTLSFSKTTLSAIVPSLRSALAMGRFLQCSCGRLALRHELAQRDLVEPAPVLAQDARLRLLGDRELREGLDRVGELRISVRVVGGEDEVRVAEPLDVLTRRLLVGLDGEEAAAPEVLARLHREVARLEPADPLVMLVEAVEEPGSPAAVALEQRHAEPREALEHAAGTEAHGRGHDPERLREGVPHEELVEDLEREIGPQVGLPPAVEGERHVEALDLAPEGVVVRVV